MTNAALLALTAKKLRTPGSLPPLFGLTHASRLFVPGRSSAGFFGLGEDSPPDVYPDFHQDLWGRRRTMKTAIETTQAPSAIGPYSQAVAVGQWVFCSGQIGIDPQTGALVAGGVEVETRRALENLREVLKKAGLGFDGVVKTTLFIIDLAEFDVVNRVYGEHFAMPYPARSTVQVAALPRGARIEIEAVAVRKA